MKLCIDCRHYAPGHEKCMAIHYINPVNGKKSYYYAAVERSADLKNDCGPEGKLFEAKNAPVQPEAAAASSEIGQ